MSFGFGPISPAGGISAEDMARLLGQAQAAPTADWLHPLAVPGQQAQAAPFGFGSLPMPQMPPQAQPLPLRIASAAPAGLPETPEAGGPVLPDFQPAPLPVEAPTPPARPLSFGSVAANPVADMPAVGAVPTAGTMPAPAASGEKSGFNIGDIFRNISASGADDMLIGLGTGLMSTRGFGNGLAAGFQNAQKYGVQRSATDLAKTEMALKQQKLARDASGQNATKNYLLSKGMDASLAEAAMSNPTVLSSTLSQLNKDPSVVQVGGNKYSLKPGEKPTEANLLGPAEAERDKATLVDVPQADGSTIKTWVKPGETSGVTLGAPERAGNSNVAVVTEERRKVATDLGWKPDSDQFKSFVATGKLPKEDQQSLTVTDKNAILEADEKIAGAKSTVSQLHNALELSKKAYSGPWASTRGYLTSMIGSEGGVATQNLDNQVTAQALENLKATFGGAPTEGERKILLDIQGASSKAPEVRDEIYRRAIASAERRQAFNEQRAKELRGGTYYKTPQATVSADGAPVAAATALAPTAPTAPTSAAVSPSASAVEYLRKNPKMRAAFDEKYGAGASDRALGGR